MKPAVAPAAANPPTEAKLTQDAPCRQTASSAHRQPNSAATRPPTAAPAAATERTAMAVVATARRGAWHGGVFPEPSEGRGERMAATPGKEHRFGVMG